MENEAHMDLRRTTRRQSSLLRSSRKLAFSRSMDFRLMRLTRSSCVSADAPNLPWQLKGKRCTRRIAAGAAEHDLSWVCDGCQSPYAKHIQAAQPGADALRMGVCMYIPAATFTCEEISCSRRTLKSKWRPYRREASVELPGSSFIATLSPFLAVLTAWRRDTLSRHLSILQLERCAPHSGHSNAVAARRH